MKLENRSLRIYTIIQILRSLQYQLWLENKLLTELEDILNSKVNGQVSDFNVSESKQLEEHKDLYESLILDEKFISSSYKQINGFRDQSEKDAFKQILLQLDLSIDVEFDKK